MSVIGCIGCGNMGSAIMRGFSSTLDKNEWQLKIYNRSPEKMRSLSALGMEAMMDIASLTQCSDILIVAVKPAQIQDVLSQIAPHLKKNSIVVSIAAGFRMEKIRQILDSSCIIARIMPTLTAETGHGVFALCFDPLNLTPQSGKEIQNLFQHLGTCLIVDEKKLAAFSAYMGATPAFVFAMMQALAQAGITLGFTRQENMELVPQLLWGCAKLAAAQKRPFCQLREEVLTPAGLTVEGCNRLDRAGFNGILIEAVLASARRAEEMEKGQD